MAKEKKTTETETPAAVANPIASARSEKETCGLIMPMSPMEGFLPDHWPEVQQILESAITKAGYEPKIVSTAKEAGVIQKRIVQNLHSLPIVVCDISGRNANVMLELGLRFAFDKLVVVVKDDPDAGSIRHFRNGVGRVSKKPAARRNSKIPDQT